MFKHIFFSACLSITLLLVGCKCPFCNSQENKKAQPAAESNHGKISQLLSITSADQFKKEVLEAKTGVVVDFFAHWCGPCRASKPIFEAVAAQLGTKYKFVVVDVESAEVVAQENHIQGIPAFLFFKDGKEVTRSIGGISSEKDFIEKIEKVFNK